MFTQEDLYIIEDALGDRVNLLKQCLATEQDAIQKRVYKEWIDRTTALCCLVTEQIVNRE
jgi:hypothetical protein